MDNITQHSDSISQHLTASHSISQHFPFRYCAVDPEMDITKGLNG
jgi:hypothetical protein